MSSTPLMFSFIEVEHEDDLFITRKTKFILKLNHFPTDASFYSFISVIYQLVWLFNFQTDFIAEVNLLSKVREEKFGPSHIKITNNLIKHLLSTSFLRFNFPQLDEDLIGIEIFRMAHFQILKRCHRKLDTSSLLKTNSGTLLSG